MPVPRVIDFCTSATGRRPASLKHGKTTKLAGVASPAASGVVTAATAYSLAGTSARTTLRAR